MDELKKKHIEIEEENKDLIQSVSIGKFLLMNHADVFNNLDTYASEMATNYIKRFMMLNGESDGIDKILQLDTKKLNEDKEFIEFIIKINEYFEKIKSNTAYEKNEQIDLLENLIYDKFRLLKEKLTSS
jgi:hypothetical protein